MSANVNDPDYAPQGYTHNDGLPARFSRILAPAGSSVHEELVRAAAEGQHTARLRYLLSQGADIDAKDGTPGLTALYSASFRGDLDNVRLLLASGADVNPFGGLAGTPICIAALRGHAHVVEALLSHRAKLVAGDDVLGSAIHCACFSGDVSIFRSLLDRGARLDYQVVVDFEILSQLAEAQDVIPAVPVVAKDPYFNFRTRHAISCSPMLVLAERCHFKLLEFCWAMYQTQPSCLQDETWHKSNRTPKDIRAAPQRPRSAGPDSDESASAHSEYRPTKTSFTLLMWAAASLRPDLVDYLLLSGAGLHAQDSRGWTALHYTAAPFSVALFENIETCVRQLVEGGADPNASNQLSQTPLILTVRWNHPVLGFGVVECRWASNIHTRCVAAFLDNGSLVATTRGAPDSILLHALHSSCRADSIELICRHSPALVSMENNGYTPLCRALCLSLSVTIIQILLRHGADPNAWIVPTDSGFSQYETPLSMAVATDATGAVIEALIGHGAHSGIPVLPESSSGRLDRTSETRSSPLFPPKRHKIPSLRVPTIRTLQISKTMAWLLRYGGERPDSGPRKGDFVSVSDVLAISSLKRMKVTFPEIREIVAVDEKQRYTMVPRSGADNRSDRPVDFLIRAN